MLAQAMQVNPATMSKIKPAEKLRRFLAHFQISQLEADRKAGAKTGRTFSYLSERVDKIPPTYLQAVTSGTDVVLDWFFDGIDDYPIGPAKSEKGGSEPIIAAVPLYGALPASFVGMISKATVGSSQSRCWLIAEDVRPGFLKGDVITVDPEVAAVHGVIALIRHEGTVELSLMMRREGEIKAESLSGDGRIAEKFATLGVVIEARRSIPGGATIIRQNSTGLSPENMIAN